jgi:Uma2 family endonuclease
MLERLENRVDGAMEAEPEICQPPRMSENASTIADLTADDFLLVDQSSFGPAWRYEMVDGRIIARAALSPDHAAILAGLTGALGRRLREQRDCRPEVGSGAVPARRQRNTARIPDGTVRCGDLPRVMFEVVSPSELAHPRQRDRKRRDLQDVEGVEEIVELYQEGSAHIYRRRGQAWVFEAIDGLDATLTLDSINLAIPLAEIYAFVEIPPEDAEQIG